MTQSLGDQALALCRDIRISGSLNYAKEVEPLFDRACALAVATPPAEDWTVRAAELVQAIADSATSSEVVMRQDEARGIAALPSFPKPVDPFLSTSCFGTSCCS